MPSPLLLEGVGPVLADDGCPEVHPSNVGALVRDWDYCGCNAEVRPPSGPYRTAVRFGHGVMLRCSRCLAETFVWWRLLPAERALWSDDGR
jgi:hypothetical protein